MMKLQKEMLHNQSQGDEALREVHPLVMTHSARESQTGSCSQRAAIMQGVFLRASCSSRQGRRRVVDPVVQQNVILISLGT